MRACCTFNTDTQIRGSTCGGVYVLYTYTRMPDESFCRCPRIFFSGVFFVCDIFQMLILLILRRLSGPVLFQAAPDANSLE